MLYQWAENGWQGMGSTTKLSKHLVTWGDRGSFAGVPNAYGLWKAWVPTQSS